MSFEVMGDKFLSLNPSLLTFVRIIEPFFAKDPWHFWTPLDKWHVLIKSFKTKTPWPCSWHFSQRCPTLFGLFQTKILDHFKPLFTKMTDLVPSILNKDAWPCSIHLGQRPLKLSGHFSWRHLTILGNSKWSYPTILGHFEWSCLTILGHFEWSFPTVSDRFEWSHRLFRAALNKVV